MYRVQRKVVTLDVEDISKMSLDRVNEEIKVLSKAFNQRVTRSRSWFRERGISTYNLETVTAGLLNQKNFKYKASGKTIKDIGEAREYLRRLVRVFNRDDWIINAFKNSAESDMNYISSELGIELNKEQYLALRDLYLEHGVTGYIYLEDIKKDIERLDIDLDTPENLIDSLWKEYNGIEFYDELNTNRYPKTW